jgi:hypothetical protein
MRFGGAIVGLKHYLGLIYLAFQQARCYSMKFIKLMHTFEGAPDAIEHVWREKEVGKAVIETKHEN